MRSIRWIIFAAVCFILVPALTQARDVNVGPEEKIATVSFPDSWKVSGTKRGVQAKSPDDEVYVWIETVPDAEINTLQKEHNDYFAKQGVTMKEAPVNGKEVDGHKWAFIEPKATWKDKPTVIRYIVINPGHPSGKTIVFTYWASPEGDKNYDAEMNKALDSLRASLNAKT